MKKIFLSVLVSVSIISSAFSADVVSVNSSVKQSFEAEFATVKNVQWTIKPEFVKATFYVNGQKVEAFYKADGEAIGKSTAINSEHLPSSAKRQLAKKYAAYTFEEAIQFDTPVETVYFVSAVGEKEKVVLKVDGSLVTVFSKTAMK